MDFKPTSPWEHEGLPTGGTIDLASAILQAKLDWDVVRLQLFGRHGSLTSEVPVYATFADVDPGNAFPNYLATVSERYKVIQNAEAFGLFEEALYAIGARYISGGMIDGGKKVYLIGDAGLDPATAVGKLELLHEKKFIVTTSHDTTMRVRVTPFLYRPLLRSTVPLISVESDVSAIHTGSTDAIKDKLLKGVSEVIEDYKTTLETLESAAQIRITSGDLTLYVMAMFRIMGVRQPNADVIQRITDLFINGRMSMASTLFDFYNAVSEYTDVYRNTRSWVGYALIGSGIHMKRAALDVVRDVVNGAFAG